MAEAAAEAKYGEITEEEKETIKAKSAAMENYGNFYGQNTFLASSGILLIASTLDSLGYKVSGWDIAQASIPVAIIMIVFGAVQNITYDRKLKKKYTQKGAN